MTTAPVEVAPVVNNTSKNKTSSAPKISIAVDRKAADKFTAALTTVTEGSVLPTDHADWLNAIHAQANELPDTCITIKNDPKPQDYKIPHIPLRLNGMKPQPVALDTGATICAVSRDWWMANRAKLPHKKATTKIQVANGQSITPWGTAVVKAIINSRPRPFTVQIIDNFAFDVLIGIEQLRKWSCKLDTDANTVTLGGQVFPILSHSSAQLPTNTELHPLVTKNTILLPASTSLVVDSVVKGYESGLNGITITDPRVLDQASVFIAKGIPKIAETGDCRVLIANTSTDDVRIPAGTQIGSLSCLDLEEYDQLDLNTIMTAAQKDETAEALVNKLLASPDQRTPIDDLSLKDSVLDSDQQAKLHSILSHFADRFVTNNQRPSQTTLTKMKIDTAEATPVNQAPYKRGPSEKEFIEKTIKENEDGKIIRKSHSPWASPVVIIRKKDGYFRFAIDYRKLNEVTKKDVYPMPRVDETLDALEGAKYLTTLDLASGYWSVPIEETDKEKTAFITHCGLYEYNVMPYGLSNAPSVFCRLMDAVLGGLKWQCVLVFVDDILIYSTSFEQHLKDIVRVFLRLRHANLSMKPAKCHFCRPSLIYLGHEISPKGIKPDPSKVVALNAFEMELYDGRNKKKLVKRLQAFLGLAQYYRRFIPAFSTIARPLYNLTKDDVKWKWTELHQGAFDELKRKLTIAPVLCHPNFNFPFVLQTDACREGLGAVLCQHLPDGSGSEPQEVVIAYASRALSPAEAKWAGAGKEWEALAIVWACELFRHYLIGKKFTIETDHKNLQWLLNQKNGRLERWALRLVEFDFLLRYKKGSANSNADALSRQPWTGESVNTSSDELLNAIENNEADAFTRAQWSDPDLRVIFKALGASNPYQLPHNPPEQDSDFDAEAATAHTETRKKQTKAKEYFTTNFKIKNNQLYFCKNGEDSKLRLVVPKAKKHETLQAFHDSPLGAHLGYRKTLSRLGKKLYWPGINKEVKEYCTACLTCALRKATLHNRRMHWHYDLPSRPFERISIDIVGLGAYKQTTAKNVCILTVVDHFTNWPEAFPLPDAKATTIANALYRGIICRHGVPKILLSDRGKQFTSTVLENLNKQLGVKHIFTTAYHPQSNAKVERFHRTLNDALAQLVNKSHSNWDAHVDSVLFAYRSSVVASLNESPFFLVHGRDPSLPTDAWMAVEDSSESPLRSIESLRLHKDNLLETFITKYREVSKLAKANKEKAVFQFNKNQKPVQFFKGDLVIVWKPPRQKKTAEVDITKKFAFRGHGPYRVIQIHEKDTYTVRHVFTHEEEKTNASKMTIYRPFQHELPEVNEHQHEVAPSTVPRQLASRKLSIPELLNSVQHVDEQNYIQVKLLSNSAQVPSRATNQSAGLDLHAPKNGSIPPNTRTLIPIDIAMQLPKSTYGRIAPRSGLSLRGIDVAGGVVDSDYRGNIGVILNNTSDEEFRYGRGDKVAQLIVENIKVLPCRQQNVLDKTQRGGHGFGSTGV